MPLNIESVTVPQDHVWHWHRAIHRHVCLICFAATAELPPVPTPQTWMPERYLKPSRELRAIAARVLPKPEKVPF